MKPQIRDIINVKIREVFPYGVIGDEIQAVVTNISNRPDSDFLASVRYLSPEKDPWYDPSQYRIGDEFVARVEEVNSFGCWALHPKGADVRLLVDGSKLGLKKGQNITLKISAIHPEHRSIDAEIIQ